MLFFGLQFYKVPRSIMQMSARIQLNTNFAASITDHDVLYTQDIEQYIYCGSFTELSHFQFSLALEKLCHTQS